MIQDDFQWKEILNYSLIPFLVGLAVKLWTHIKTSSQKEQNLVNKVESIEKDLHKMSIETEKRFKKLDEDRKEERREYKEEIKDLKQDISKVDVKQDQILKFLLTHFKDK